MYLPDNIFQKLKPIIPIFKIIFMILIIILCCYWSYLFFIHATQSNAIYFLAHTFLIPIIVVLIGGLRKEIKKFESQINKN
jgi:hypothetical protein